MADLKAHPPGCLGDDSQPPAAKASGHGPSGLLATLYPATVDSLHLHSVVLDDRCRVISQDTLALPDSGQTIKVLWLGMKDAEGKHLQTGVYYVNEETVRADGARDTTYHKYGYYRDPCFPD